MLDECSIARNLRVKQDSVFRLAEKRGISLALISAETEIPLPTLQSYRSTPSRKASVMSLATFIKLARALPDDLASLLIEDSEYYLSPLHPVDRDWMAFAEKTAAFTSKVCHYQVTGGHIDHCEDQDLAEEARQLAAEAQRMVAPGKVDA